MLKGGKIFTAIYRILVSHQVLQTLARPAILCHAGSYMTVYVQSLTSYQRMQPVGWPCQMSYQ